MFNEDTLLYLASYKMAVGLWLIAIPLMVDPVLCAWSQWSPRTMPYNMARRSKWCPSYVALTYFANFGLLVGSGSKAMTENQNAFSSGMLFVAQAVVFFMSFFICFLTWVRDIKAEKPIRPDEDGTKLVTQEMTVTFLVSAVYGYAVISLGIFSRADVPRMFVYRNESTPRVSAQDDLTFEVSYTAVGLYIFEIFALIMSLVFRRSGLLTTGQSIKGMGSAKTAAAFAFYSAASFMAISGSHFVIIYYYAFQPWDANSDHAVAHTAQACTFLVFVGILGLTGLRAACRPMDENYGGPSLDDPAVLSDPKVVKDTK